MDAPKAAWWAGPQDHPMASFTLQKLRLLTDFSLYPFHVPQPCGIPVSTQPFYTTAGITVQDPEPFPRRHKNLQIIATETDCPP